MTVTTQIIDILQGTDKWYDARCGMLTASVIGNLITPSTLQPAHNETARGVTSAIIAERITGHVEHTTISADMERGLLDEPYARAAYAEHYAPVTETGLIIRETDTYRLGYSPDGLIGDDGAIEIKSRRQKTQLATIIADEVPAANMAQLQCGLLVSDRAWIDYVSYCGGMPLYVKRVHRDDEWITAIEAAAAEFEATATRITSSYQSAVAGRPTTKRIDHDAEIEF